MVKDNKQNNTNKQAQAQPVPITMVEEKKHGNGWRNTTIVLAILLIMLMAVTYFVIMIKLNPTSKQQIILGVGGFATLIGLGALFIIKKTVGFPLIGKMLRLNSLKRKGYILLKINTLSKRPQWQLKLDAPIIHYKFKENGINKNKLVISDTYAKYNDFGGDYTIMEATPNGILPIDRHTGNRIGMTPEIIDKFVIDSSKSAEEIDSLKKNRKMLLYILMGLGVALVVGFDLYSQRLAEAQKQVTDMAKLCGTKGTIVAGGFVREIYNKYKNKQ